MKLKEICSYLDTAAPLSFQEGYDNSGLQVGLPETDITSALLTLDVTGEVIEEAISEKCNLIISHHPVIFSPLKRLTGKTMPERVLLMAVKNDISVYSSHTNLDVTGNGVSWKMSEKLGLNGVKVLVPLKNSLLKLVAYIPENYLDDVRDAVFDAGAGVTGKYDRCGFYVGGTGSFRAGENANPFVGEKGKLHFEKEVRFETVLFSHNRQKVIDALLKVHPYEEAAFDLYSLDNEYFDAGMGCVGELREPLAVPEFLELLSSVFGTKGIRYSGHSENRVSRVALCGGSGSALIKDAVERGADAFVTADLKYHNYLDAGNDIMLVDCGHYETEKFSVEILYDLIIKKFPKFAIRFSKTNTNPINYF